MPFFGDDDALKAMRVPGMATVAATPPASPLLVHVRPLHPVPKVPERHVETFLFHGVQINTRAPHNRRRIWMAWNLPVSRCLHHDHCKVQVGLADPSHGVADA